MQRNDTTRRAHSAVVFFYDSIWTVAAERYAFNFLPDDFFFKKMINQHTMRETVFRSNIGDGTTICYISIDEQNWMKAEREMWMKKLALTFDPWTETRPVSVHDFKYGEISTVARN